MRYLLTSLVFFLGCAHLPATPATRFEAMADDELARLAVQETLGAAPDFATLEERHAFELRVDGLVRGVTNANGSLMHLVYVRCERARTRFILTNPMPRSACDYAESGVTLSTLAKKPMLHRAFVDALLESVRDERFARDARANLERLSAEGTRSAKR